MGSIQRPVLKAEVDFPFVFHFKYGEAELSGRSTQAQAAANGYWVMLRPLAKGRHTIEFGGALPSILQAVTYTLVVE